MGVAEEEFIPIMKVRSTKGTELGEIPRTQIFQISSLVFLTWDLGERIQMY